MTVASHDDHLRAGVKGHQLVADPFACIMEFPHAKFPGKITDGLVIVSQFRVGGWRIVV